MHNEYGLGASIMTLLRAAVTIPLVWITLDLVHPILVVPIVVGLTVGSTLAQNIYASFVEYDSGVNGREYDKYAITTDIIAAIITVSCPIVSFCLLADCALLKLIGKDIVSDERSRVRVRPSD